MVGVGLEPSSGLRVRKKMKETTIIEVNTIYSPELLNDWDLHMARPRQTDRQTCNRFHTSRTYTYTHAHAHTQRVIQVSLSGTTWITIPHLEIPKQTESPDWWKTFIYFKMTKLILQLWSHLTHPRLHFCIRTLFSPQCSFKWLC